MPAEEGGKISTRVNAIVDPAFGPKAEADALMYFPT